jgi:hypothetical protein
MLKLWMLLKWTAQQAGNIVKGLSIASISKRADDLLGYPVSQYVFWIDCPHLLEPLLSR